ncbi:MAG: threonine synthase [Oscillospiraceae bacterium]|nr:threonine synthase [Oscillospiraceae bacterium]
MQYTSTRDSGVRVSAAEAVARGICPDGGLYVPTEIPVLTADDFAALKKMDYVSRAAFIIGKYLTDFSADELDGCLRRAYDVKTFHNNPAPVVRLGGGKAMLELWHGPTCAFKDMALQLLPHLLTASVKKRGDEREIIILVATSGDTGKAALDGFAGLPGARIVVFYPEQGVSRIQQLQMTTQEGGNVAVFGVKGNFDDAQNGVKRIFTDGELRKALNEKGMAFSSANSINWGRLVPQIVYYISAYLDLNFDLNEKKPVNITVPTGNFGNILAAFYAMRMGLPVNKLICASNRNNILTDFIRTGIYDRHRDFYATMSPSMDILISSNLERLLWILADGEGGKIKNWMDNLSATGRYEVDDGVKSKLRSFFRAGYCDDAATGEEIRRVFDNEKYLCDTHTAVACRVYREYRDETGDSTETIIASTASPFKFSSDVLAALGGDTGGLDEFDVLAKLEEISGLTAPPQLTALKTKPVRFRGVCDKDNMRETVMNLLI